MSRTIWSWVIALATTLAMTVSLLGVGAPAFADDFNPPAPTVNDPAGTTQDWFMLAEDPNGFYSWSYGESDTQGIPANQRVYTGGASSITVYARHYQGMVRSFSMTFTNASGAAALNSVTLHTDQMVCGKYTTGVTWLPVTFNETYDGSGLVTYYPGVRFSNEYEISELQGESQKFPSAAEVLDGGSLQLDAVNTSWTGLLPGWYDITVIRLASPTGPKVYELTSTRLWVPSCDGSGPPPGHVPPGGTEPGEGGSETGQSAPTGKLKLLRRAGKVKVKAINRKVARLTTFKLKRPGVKKTIVIKAPAGKVIIKRVKALKPGKYRLKASVKKDGKVRYKTVAILVVKQR